MVDRLRLAGAAAIAFDVVFPEPDRTSPGVYADSLSNVEAGVVEALRALPNNDEALAQALSQTRLVLGQSAYHRDVARKGHGGRKGNRGRKGNPDRKCTRLNPSH